MDRGSMALGFGSTKVVGGEIAFSASDLILSHMVERVRAKDHPNQFDTTELKKICEVSPRTVDHRLRTMVESGLLTRGGHGRYSNSIGYRVTPCGFDRIDKICAASETLEIAEAKELLRGVLPPVVVAEAPSPAAPINPVIPIMKRAYIEPALAAVRSQESWTGRNTD